MPIIGTALGNDVHNSADCPACFNAVSIVDYAKFTYGISGGRCFLHTGGRRDIVSPIDRNKVVVNVLAGEGELGYRLNDHVGAAGCGVADRNARREESEINELPAVHRQILKLRLL